MLNHPPKPSQSGARNGFALLAVLAFVLLLTILVVSYISYTGLNRLSTVSYAASVQAQEIAKGGLQDVIGDLNQEIIAGSINPASSTYTQGTAPNQATIYIPINNLTAVPARLGYPNTGAANVWYYGLAATATLPTATPVKLLPSLVRVSRASSGAATDLNPPLNTSNYTNTIAASSTGGIFINRASPVSTATPSVNSHYISASRWNKSFLLAPTTSLIPSTFTAAPPDWVYVTRTGSRVCANTSAEIAALKPSAIPSAAYSPTLPGQNPTASPVIGRYAFIMYNEGALLDANVAGYTGASTNLISSPIDPATGLAASDGMTQATSGKSFESYADLTQLPGFYNAALATAQGRVDPLVSLRNASTTPVASGNSYLTALVTYARNGFLNFQPSDSPFVSRQDLINYFTKVDPSINTSSATISQALTYLGTFTRAVSAPTYFPPADAATLGGNNGTGGIYAYNANAESSLVSSTPIANRDLANLRFPASMAASTSITHYNDDGTTSTYLANPGDQLLQGRFSLSRLNWFNKSDPLTGPPTSLAGAMQACFGLSWGVVGPIANGGNACWKYIGSNNNFTGTIETLDMVAAEKREPNFFELLKAAILSGSLGLGPGLGGWNNGNVTNSTQSPFSFKDFGTYSGGSESLDAYSYDRAGLIPAPAGISDVQIIKIGANIIDQYDTDSYPTAIYFHYSYNNTATSGTQLPSPYDAAAFKTIANGGANDISGPSDMVFGDENIPYLQGAYNIVATDTATDNNNLNSWWQPNLWNPHQQPLAPTNAQALGTPNKFRIRAYGTSYIFWINHNTAAPTSGDTTQIALDNDYITFQDANPATSVFYAHPTLLTTNSTGISNISTIDDLILGPSPHASQMLPSSSIAGYSNNNFIGFWMGTDATYNVEPDPATNESRVQTDSGVTFSLGWVDASNHYHPYSYLQQIVGYSYSVQGQEKGDTEHGSATTAANSGDAEFHTYIDPRTYRFSDLAGWGWAYVNSTMYPNNLGPPGGSNSDNFGQGRPVSPNFVYTGTGNYYEDGWLANSATPPSSLTATYYTDPDGVIRPGDGLYFNSGSGHGNMLYIVPGTTGSSTAFGDVLKGSGVDDATTANSSGNNRNARRPVILNRPFRSVGELSYVFRDLPFKTLDFFSALSADAALLDVFSITDDSKIASVNNQLSSVVAGQVDLSNASYPVIAALLSGASKKDVDITYNIGFPSAALDLNGITTQIGANLLPSNATPNPILNRAALATRIGPLISNAYLLYSGNKNNKANIEAPIRALSEVTNTRTWNLLVDIIAQSGQLTSSAQSLSDFVVSGEKRYWLHISIDRYTGKIISQQLEPVYE